MNPKPETDQVMIKAVIYDMDGLLVDSEPWWRALSSLGTSQYICDPTPSIYTTTRSDNDNLTRNQR